MTPLLATKYKEYLSQGKKFEIIFISSDESDTEAKEYFASMPWKMLAFSETETRDRLSEQFNVEGIPTLVILDEEENILTTEGTDAVMNVASFEQLKTFEMDREIESKRIIKPSTLFEGKLMDKSGIVDSSCLDNKLIGLYFSAHW